MKHPVLALNPLRKPSREELKHAGKLGLGAGVGVAAAELLSNPSHTYDVDRMTFSEKLYLRKVRLNAGGYDERGRYFGGGHDVPSLWEYSSDRGEVHDHVRASSREEAKRKIRERYPKASFYR